MKNIGVDMSGWIHEDVRNILPIDYETPAYKIFMDDVHGMAYEIILYEWKLKIVWPRS